MFKGKLFSYLDQIIWGLREREREEHTLIQNGNYTSLQDGAITENLISLKLINFDLISYNSFTEGKRISNAYEV